MCSVIWAVYTHRVAISNHRLVSFTDGEVTFRWRDSAHNNEQRSLPLSVDEFLRRFLLHLLPEGFVRIETSASWPIANVPPTCHFVSNCSVRHRNRASGRLRPSERSLVLPQVWWADDGRRKTHRC